MKKIIIIAVLHGFASCCFLLSPRQSEVALKTELEASYQHTVKSA